MSLTICCVQQGNYLGRGAEYVNVLYDMCIRNLAEGYRGKFVCFTDDANGLDPAIIARPLPADGLNGWYNKVALFKPGVFSEDERVLYFDLDTLITGRLDEIASYEGDFAILADFFKPTRGPFSGLQSGVMAWRGGHASEIWSDYEALGCPEVPGGDQAWIRSHYNGTPDLWQSMYPGLFVSYKGTGGAVPDRASVVCFHGLPRPHEVLTGWVPAVWRIGGMSRADLDVICNTVNQKLLANIESACTRDLRWFEFMEPHEGHACIVGSGPWLPDSLEEIRWRHEQGQSIWAVNGSAQWLESHGITPDFHVLLDARPENIDFIKKPDKWPDPITIYLVASQCDPTIFDRLADSDVIVYHNQTPFAYEYLSRFETNKPVHLFGGCTTVGIKAMTLAFRSGFRNLHLYGIDASYRDGQSHAYEQALNADERVLDVVCGDRTYKASAWMVTQAKEDFQNVVNAMLEEAPETVVTVAGDGLLHQVALLMSQPRILMTSCCEVRADEVLRRLNDTAQPFGAEIGVFAGSMSAVMLASRPDLRLAMIDPWEGDGASYVRDTDDFNARLSQPAQDRYAVMAAQNTEFAADRRQIIRKRSVDAARTEPLDNLDFVFIDADHSYEGCKADIEAWWPKVKPGGWLCGHDYDDPSFPKFGVVPAVHEFADNIGAQIELGDNYTWFIRKEQ